MSILDQNSLCYEQWQNIDLIWMWFRKSVISDIKWPITPLYIYQTKNQNHLAQFHIQPYHHIKFKLNLVTTPYRHPWVYKFRNWNKLTFLAEKSCFMTPGGPVLAWYAPLVDRIRLGHLNMTHENPKSWYWQPADHLEVVRKCYEKAPSEKGDFGGVLKNRLLWPICSSSVKIWSGLVISHNSA